MINHALSSLIGRDDAGGGGLWTPADLGSIAHWYRAKSITDGIDGNDYAVWEDLIGSADTSSSNPPKYYSNSGNPYLEFDGVNNYLHINLSPMNDFTYVIIAEIISYDAYERILEDGVICIFPAFGSLYSQISGANNITRILPATPTGFMAIFYQRNGSNGKFRLNGSEATDTIVTTATGTTLRVGEYVSAGYNGNIRLKEKIICNDDITGGEFTELENYIFNEHGSTL